MEAQKVLASDEDSPFAADCLVGSTFNEYGDGGYVWALFNLCDIDPQWIEQHNDKESNFDLAYALTKWDSFYRGAGRWFGQAPYCKFGRTRVLVKQYRGLDI